MAIRQELLDQLEERRKSALSSGCGPEKAEARHAKERHETPLPLSWRDMQQQLMLVMKHVAMASGKERFTRQSKSKFFNYAKYVCYFNDFSS